MYKYRIKSIMADTLEPYGYNRLYALWVRVLRFTLEKHPRSRESVNVGKVFAEKRGFIQITHYLSDSVWGYRKLTIIPPVEGSTHVQVWSDNIIYCSTVSLRAKNKRLADIETVVRELDMFTQECNEKKKQGVEQ